MIYSNNVWNLGIDKYVVEDYNSRMQFRFIYQVMATDAAGYFLDSFLRVDCWKRRFFGLEDWPTDGQVW